MVRNYLRGFPERLQKAMDDKGINQKELARKIGCDKKAPMTWLQGASTPNVVYFARMCKILGVSAQYMLYGEE